jgi:hypothetical protein
MSRLSRRSRPLSTLPMTLSFSLRRNAKGMQWYKAHTGGRCRGERGQSKKGVASKMGGVTGLWTDSSAGA